VISKCRGKNPAVPDSPERLHGEMLNLAGELSFPLTPLHFTTSVSSFIRDICYRATLIYLRLSESFQKCNL
jgi:hypothetical protein